MLQLSCNFRGDFFPVTIPDTNTVQQLKVCLAALTAVPETNQKIIHKGKNLGRPEFNATTLKEQKVKTGSRLLLVGATEVQVDLVKDDEDDARIDRYFETLDHEEEQFELTCEQFLLELEQEEFHFLQQKQGGAHLAPPTHVPFFFSNDLTHGDTTTDTSTANPAHASGLNLFTQPPPCVASPYYSDAMAGNVNAQHELGFAYYTGQSCLPKSRVEAAVWFKKAALQGHTDAMFYYGHCLRDGQGVPEDKVLASYWYAEAARRGHTNARMSLVILEKSGDFVMPTSLPSSPIFAQYCTVLGSDQSAVPRY